MVDSRINGDRIPGIHPTLQNSVANPHEKKIDIEKKESSGLGMGGVRALHSCTWAKRRRGGKKIDE